ncbi:hypothetical protein JCM10213_009102 [Rhodosporidiobolus nylandii]
MGYQYAVLSLAPAPIARFLVFANLLSPLNLSLLAVLFFLLYRLIPAHPTAPQPWNLPSQPSAYNWRPSFAASGAGKAQVWQKWTPTELSKFDGTQDGGKGRVLLAVRRKAYDVSQGRGFYGPGGPYSAFAGRDASRGLAHQSFEADMLHPLGQFTTGDNGKEHEEIDALQDLGEGEWSGLAEWEEHFRNKYPVVGDLVPCH